jgi:hypothetical protein
MLFDDLDDITRTRTIRLLQESLDDDFRRHLRNRDLGAHYFQDIVPTMPGFTTVTQPTTAAFKVHVNPVLFKR